MLFKPLLLSSYNNPEDPLYSHLLIKRLLTPCTFGMYSWFSEEIGWVFFTVNKSWQDLFLKVLQNNFSDILQ